MIYVISYFFGLFIVFILLRIKRTKTKPIPKINFNTKEIYFNSFSRHKILVGKCAIMQISNTIYLKKDGKMLIIKNVKDVLYLKNYIYFTSQGKLEILLNLESISPYLNIKIYSNYFNLSKQREIVEREILNNLFNINNCKELNRYIIFIKKILNIQIQSNSIKIGQNKYKLPYTIYYSMKGKTKKINVNSKQIV